MKTFVLLFVLLLSNLPAWAHSGDALAPHVKPDGRIVKLSFSGKVHGDLPVTFTPSVKDMRVEVGRKYELSYKFENKSDKDLPILAVHSVNPTEAGATFKKFVCFCFEDQNLKAKAKVDMPIVFLITPDLPKDVKELKIDYTLYLKKAPDVEPAQGGKYSNRLKKSSKH